MMNRVLSKIYSVLFYVCVLMITAITISTVIDVIGRPLGRPLPGANEMIGLMLVVLIACGVGFTQKSGQHIAVGVVVDLLPLNIRRLLVLISLIFGFCLAAFIVWRGLPFAAESKRANEYTELLRFPWYPLKYIIVFGSAIWALQYLVDAINQAFRLLSHAEADEITDNHETEVL